MKTKYHYLIRDYLPCYCGYLPPTSTTTIKKLCDYCFDIKRRELLEHKEQDNG